MLFKATIPIARASGSSSSRATGRIARRMSCSVGTVSSFVAVKKRSVKRAPKARLAGSEGSLIAFTSSSERRCKPPCSTRSVRRPAASKAASWSSSLSELPALTITGSTSERWRWMVCPSLTTLRTDNPWTCMMVHPCSGSLVSCLSMRGRTAPDCFVTSCSRPLRKSSPCSSFCSCSSSPKTQETISWVARGPTEVWSNATTRPAEERTSSASSMMACWMAGMRSSK
mmetsp:Transcript_55251/g.117843  ORF Transcript_55251/g.117843 Transcript_55251/m.117843 type:complete len:228 (-) Transcript_55251:1728-2411(-)